VNPLRAAAVSTVTLALVLYSLGTFAERRRSRADGVVLGLLTAGVSFDTLATALMIAATGSLAPSLHGVLGYSALALMLVHVIALWRHRARAGSAELSPRLRGYGLIAYAYWVIAYFAGAALVMAAHRAAR